MKRSKHITAVSLIAGLLSAPLSELAAEDPEKKTPKPRTLNKVSPGLMRAVTELPDDPALPALKAIRAACQTGAAPSGPGFDGRTVEFLLRGYTPGKRVTLEARVGRRRVALKAYAEDPSPEVALYQSLAAGLGGDSRVRVPPLLGWDRDLRVLLIGWLEGPTAQQLVEGGEGGRAGELAAQWVQRAVSLRVKIGPPFGAARMLRRSSNWVAHVTAADSGLGLIASGLSGMLARTEPLEGAPRLVHGTFYARHVLDLGDGSGVIDWQRFGQGPSELDAGMFLATCGASGCAEIF